MKKSFILTTALITGMLLPGCNKEEIVDSVSISSNSPHQIVFMDYDQFNINGIEVIRTMRKGKKTSDKKVDEGLLTYTLSTAANSEDLSREVTLSYEFKGTTYNLNYTIYKADSIKITSGNVAGSEAYKMDYIEYSLFDDTGLTVELFDKSQEHHSNIAGTEQLVWCSSSDFSESITTKSSKELKGGSTEVVGYGLNHAKFHVSASINAVSKISSIRFDEATSAVKKEYFVGDVFSLAGAKIYGSSDAVPGEEILVATSHFNTYDGTSYSNNPTDKTKWSKTFALGTTSVAIELASHADVTPIIVEGIVIKDASIGKGDEGLSLTLLKDVTNLKNGDQVLICSATAQLVLDLTNKDVGYKMLISNDVDLTADAISIDSSFSGLLFNVTKSNDKFKFTLASTVDDSKPKVLTTGSSGIVVTEKSNNSLYEVTVSSTGDAVVHGTYTNTATPPVTTDKYLWVNGSNKFSFGSNEYALKIYKA